MDTPHTLCRFHQRTAAAIVFSLIASTALAQPGASPSEVHSAALLQQINTAASHHFTTAALGRLWLELGAEYQHQALFPQSEAAYTRSLTLLNTPSTERGYSDALDGLAALYFQTGRLPESETCLRKALVIDEAIGDQPRIARAHFDLASDLVKENNLAAAEAESAEALRELQSETNPDASDHVSALLAHSYAVCLRGRCTDALADLSQAMSIAHSSLPPDSLELSAVWLASGHVHWHAGLTSEADHDMREALRIVKDSADLASMARTLLEVSILHQYGDFLRATHRRSEARQIETQIQQLSTVQRRDCTNCTVNAVALSNTLR
jgi:tetratricopeptide (TPR) repeat protein